MKINKRKIKAAEVESFIKSNKIFVVFAIIAIIILLGGFALNDKKEKDAAINSSSTTSISDSEIIGGIDETVHDERVDTNINSDTEKEKELPKWRFYWIDLWIFLIAGGFCLIKILQEKKRAREKLK